MAIVPKGSLLDGMRGRLGDLVFRVQGDQTIVSLRPKQKKTPQNSKTLIQQKTASRFQKAVAFAKTARGRNSFRSLSRLLGGHSPYHVALQDFLSKPAIVSIDANEIGASGGKITIQVSERVAVRSVRVRLLPGRRIKETVQGEGNKPPVPSSTRPPAARFFQKVDHVSQPGSLTARKTNLPCDTRPMESHTSHEPQPAPASTNAPPAEVRAFRVTKIEPGRGLSSRVPIVEIWQADLPWSGEIDISAFDYAGNRASNAYFVGPL